MALNFKTFSTHTKYFHILISALVLMLMPSLAFGQENDDSFANRLAFHAEFDPTTAFLINNNIDESTQLGSHITDFAAGYLGKPYRRGAKGPSAFDCSGFTSYVFKQFGISLGASSQAQYTQGEAIDLLDAQPGDLIFFSGSRISKTRVGHVGIIVDIDDDGRATFIHAALSGGIRYDVTTDPYYSKRLIGAKRMIP